MEDLADFTIKNLEELGASYVEARVEQSSSNGFLLKNGIPQISGFNKVEGLGVRFILNKALGFFSTNNLDKENIKKLINNSVKITKSSTKLSEDIIFASEVKHSDKYEVKQKINLELEADKSILDTKVNVPGRYLHLNDFILTEYLANSEGTKIKATIPRIGFMYFLTANENNKSMQRYWQYGATTGFESIKKWDVDKIVSDEVLAMKNIMRYAVKAPKGKLDVVVGPQVTGIMVHESVGHPYEADRILGREAAQAGESFVTKDMIGSKIGSEIVNVAEDPTIPGSFGYYLYDNEGVKARRKYLIKNGLINEFLHNRQTAAMMNVKSNGCSRAISYDRESIVRMANTFLLEGDYKEDELIEGTKNGIFMKNFTEWNIDDKRLNQKYVGAEAYLIENGEITKPVFNPVIEISTPNLWKAVSAIANNTEYHAGTCGKGEPTQGIPVWFGGPSMKISNIRLN